MIDIRLPYSFPAEAELPLVVEHPPLNTRIPETFLAMALSLSQENKVAFLAPKVSRFKSVLAEWLEAMGVKKMKSLWITNSLDDSPFSSIDHLFVVNANALPPLRHECRQVRVCGEFSNRSHWFYTYARRPEVTLVRITADEVLKKFPQEIPDIGRVEYERRYMLIDKDETDNFFSFTRKRLFITTDKKTLCPEQRAFVHGLGTPLVPFYLTSLQRRYEAMKRLALKRGMSPRFLLLKYRRGGFTTLEQAKSYHLATTRSNSNVITLAHTASSTSRIFRIVERFHNNDPRAPELASDSRTRLDIASNGSLFFVGTAGGKGVSRGDTLQRVHGSEVSKWCEGPRQGELVDDLVAGLVGACSNGEVVLETTPNGYEWFAHTYVEAKQGLNDWVPLFLPWFVDPDNSLSCDHEEILDTISTSEQVLMQKAKKFGVTISPEQIAFRRKKQREYKRLFQQEYPEDEASCFLTSGTPFFDIELAMSLIDILPDGNRKSIPGGYSVEWESPQDKVKYVCGVDTSEGLPRGDLNGFGIMRKDTGAQVAACHGRFRPDELARLTLKACIRYNNALLGIERNNHGHSVLQWIQEHGPSTYRRAHNRGGRLYHHTEKRAGWPTDAATRPIMLDDLYEWMNLENIGDLVRDKDFLQEQCTFKLQASGKYEHDTGCHDDTIFKWAVSNQMRKARVAKLRIIVRNVA